MIAVPTASTLASLRAAYAGRLWTEPADTAPFLTDWRGKWTGPALAVAQPADTAEVAQLLAWCHAHGVPVVPQGGNTGLSGGSVPEAAGQPLPLLLSLTRLNRVRHVDALNNTLVVEAGATLQQVQDAARAAGRLFPLSLAAEGSCTIGGNLATNAGGVQVLRYGNARELCLGLEVVTPEGEVWNGLRTLRKDNTGYDLRDLYIGSEGTLGVITAAVLKLFPLPAAQMVALVAVPSPGDALQLLALAQQRLGASLTAFELLSDTCMALVLHHVPGSRRPLAEASPWYVLLEISVTGAQADAQAGAAQAMEDLLGAAMEAGWVADAALSTTLAQFEALWALRENISEAQGAEGPTIKHDIALPISRVPEFIAGTDALVGAAFPQVRQVTFGHLGDGNLHYNASPAAAGPLDSAAKAAFLALEGPLNRLVHDAVHALGGSISAEHGLGVLRRDESERYKAPLELRLMQRIKSALDPAGLMNPAKLLPETPVAHRP
ncbi:FAD-binding oxidoreductase [Acidovorax sp. Root219]|uniref:FAD-binding oxidoreductase n=1 Tax=Acidovorax sp. Root219 TaxID=1736493 RepID=UPI00070CE15B|nr:FAD-binding oxidoreductase [Acidovorax sp. Root219]KRC32510.1 hydroxyacid dehydrogenase [Acidovorax sp. Root219]